MLFIFLCSQDLRWDDSKIIFGIVNITAFIFIVFHVIKIIKTFFSKPPIGKQPWRHHRQRASPRW